VDDKANALLVFTTFSASGAGPMRGGGSLDDTMRYERGGSLHQAADVGPAARSRILVIDDSPFVLDMLEEVFESHGWEVETAASGVTALDIAASWRPDVVVCDLRMPGMDGAEVHQQVAALDATTAFIMLSGEADLAVVLELVRGGVFDYVQKESGTEALVAAADRAIRHVRVVRENLRLSQDLVVMNRELEQRLKELEASRAISLAKERLEREMEIASTIQTSILPRQVQAEGFEFAGRLIPASDVGGDYYDVTPVPGGGVWLGIGDVSGHGLAAGLIMLMVQSGLGSILRTRQTLMPSEALRALNELLVENVRRRMEKDDHVTLSLMHFRGNGQAIFAGAHEDMVVWRAATRKCEVVQTHGTWVGIRRGLAFPDQRLRLFPGDTLLLYTDGAVEAMNAQRAQLGLDRLVEWFCELADQSVERIRDQLIGRVQAWQAEQFDDLTVLVVRYLGSPGGAEDAPGGGAG
jgi:serine phosphatase RsbU (regulator of sigma subunit)